MKFRIGVDEHLSMVGKTGGGKTTVARSLLRNRVEQSKDWADGWYFIFILDTKQRGDFRDFKDFHIVKKLRDLAPAAQKHRLIIYQPGRDEKNLEHYEGFLGYCLECGPHLLYVDELFDLIRGGVPENYEAYMKLGRGAAQSLWQATQNPVFIPHDFFSNSTHMFVFRLKLQSARDKIVPIVGDELHDKSAWPDRYGYWYSSDYHDEPVYVPNTYTGFALANTALDPQTKEDDTPGVKEGLGLSNFTKWLIGLLIFALLMALLIPVWHLGFKWLGGKIGAAGSVANYMQE